MNPRLTLVLILVVLFGGAGALLYFSSGQQGQRPTPIAPAPATASSVTPTLEPGPAAPEEGSYPRLFVLAVTWFPGFCELHPAYAECRNPSNAQNARFALHGLWPQDDYCGVSDALRYRDLNEGWNGLPEVELSEATWSALRMAMPGTKSHLERHEWLAHGTCSGVSQETYFRTAAALVATLNGSGVPDLFNDNLGDELTNPQIRTAFDKSLGSGAGKRVRVGCERLDGHDTIVELTIALYGEPFAGDDLRTLMATAHPRGPGCDSGLVDR